MDKPRQIKVVKQADIKKVEVSPKEMLKSLRTEYRRRMRSLEKEMLTKLDLVVQNLK